MSFISALLKEIFLHVDKLDDTLKEVLKLSIQEYNAKIYILF